MWITYLLIYAEPKERIGLSFLLYESSVLPLNYFGNFINCPSCALLLGALFFLPCPLFKPAQVGLSESQLGQINRRLFSTLFLQLPSIWSATSGTTLVFWFTSDHPHKQHLSSYLILRYFFIQEDTRPILVIPSSFPSFQLKINFEYSYSRWHLLLQYL